MNKLDKVLAVWQPQGYSTHNIAREVAQKLNTKLTHTGTLDPMAEGVIVLVLGEERYKKSEYTNCIKGYKFDVAFGISTDSFDGMGHITSVDYPETLLESRLLSALPKLEGPYEQTVPLYSAIRYKGKKLFDYARSNLPVAELPKKSGVIHKLSLTEISVLSIAGLINDVTNKIKNIKGDFRQDGIIEAWSKYLSKVDPAQKIFVGSFYVEMTRGLYVRSLSQDICRLLGVGGFVSSLVRTKNGGYTRENSCDLSEILG